MSSLSHLDMTQCDICDEQTSLLLSLKLLRFLKIGRNDITDIGLKNIGMLLSLHDLSIENCWEITDEGLLYLSPLVLLGSIDISGCYQLSNRCWIYLSKLPLLKEIMRRELCDHDKNIIDAAPEQMKMKIFIKK